MSDSRKSERHARGLEHVSVPVGTVAAPAVFRRGFNAAMLVDWPSIVGSAVASHALPDRIAFPKGERSGGTLHIRVANGSFATILQHYQPQIIERVNAWFGYGAVARIAINQGPLPRRQPPPQPKPAVPPPPERKAVLEQGLAGIEDEELRQALAALGERIASHQG